MNFVVKSENSWGKNASSKHLLGSSSLLTHHNIIPSGASLFISQIESNPDRATNIVSPFLSQAFGPTVQD